MSEMVHHGRIEYTSPSSTTRVQRVTGVPPAARRPTYDPDHERAARFAEAQRRYDARKARQLNPDLELRGRVVPYGVQLPDPARGDRLLFTADTVWDSDWFVPVRLDHGPRPLGVATIAELADDGLYVSSTIPGPLAKSLNGRRQLSVAISAVRTRRLADGVLEVTGCQIDEISLCRRAVWQPPLTSCTLTPLAA